MPSELALTAYLRDLVAKRRADPDDSLLSALVAVEEEGDRLSSGELVSTALLLLVAGFRDDRQPDRERHRRPARRRPGRSSGGAWAEDPSLVPAAVEELLRYDSPVQMTSRIATEDVDIGGTVIAKGASVIVAIGGANRDPDVFDEPGPRSGSTGRTPRGTWRSRSGSTTASARALARLEGRIAVEELTRRYPALELAGIAGPAAAARAARLRERPRPHACARRASLTRWGSRLVSHEPTATRELHATQLEMA